MTPELRKAPTVAPIDAREKNKKVTQPIVSRPRRNRQCGDKPTSGEKAPGPLPLLRQLVTQDDFADDLDPSTIRFDMVAQANQMLADHAASELSRSVEAILADANPLDMGFIVRAVTRWKADEGADCIQPGSLVSAILREAGFGRMNDAYADQVSKSRALDRARRRLTAAGIQFCEE